MKISALSSLFVLAASAAPAGADRKEIVMPAEHITVRAAVRSERSPAALATGELGLTGARRERRDAFLDAREVAAEVRPYAPDIERCYVERLDDVRRAGRLDLTLVIGRDGYLVSLDAAAPGLPARTVRTLALCIREAVDALHFPARRNDTTVIVPYLFQHTDTPGGGPQLSCWKPKGC